MRHITALFASAAIALGTSAVASPAFAADDIGSNPITEFFDGLGLGDKEKPDLDYQERAPLVPPSSAASLPAPQAKGAARANTQWPNDPDLQARAEKRARDNKVPTETYSYRMDRSPRLDPDELGARRTAGANVPRAAGGTAQDNTVQRSDPGDLASRPITEVATPAGRNRLTDPPAGYMVGNGVQAAPAAPEQKPWYKKMFGG